MSQERLEASLGIDRASTEEIVRIIQEQDATIAAAMRSQAAAIARAIDAIADRLRHGGRLFYAGAGTSGRIAMLDATEIPPTYNAPPDLVQVLMAGGEKAFFSAVEGSEDDEQAAVANVNARVRADDCLVGIAASGTTPYTVAAVRRANLIGALTVGVSSVAGSPLASECDIAITPETGPEVILGSTRMKAGTAQKLVLNTLSTGVMIQLGKTYSNLMVEMPATNEKLRARAVRMVELAAGVARSAAASAIAASAGSVKEAILIAKRGVPADEAKEMLRASGGNLRKVLGE